MAHHHPKNTVSAPKYCGKCARVTQHKVADGRIGACLDCCERLELEHEARDAEQLRRGPAAKQGGLF